MTLLAALIACSGVPEGVSMTGRLLDAPEGLGDPVEGAVLATFDDIGAPFAEATTDADGVFAVDVPAAAAFFLTASADGLVPTAFNGVGGVVDFASTDGYPWIAQPSFVEDVRAQHGACAGVAEEGAIVVGEARWAVDGVSVDNYPPAEDVEILVEDTDGAVRTACVHDDDGASLADGTVTSTDGAFAVFGLPAGAARVQAWHEDDAGEEVFAVFDFVVPEGGLVPMYPLALD